jgi:hypothetical protein
VFLFNIHLSIEPVFLQPPLILGLLNLSQVGLAFDKLSVSGYVGDDARKARPVGLPSRLKYLSPQRLLEVPPGNAMELQNVLIYERQHIRHMRLGVKKFPVLC